MESDMEGNAENKVEGGIDLNYTAQGQYGILDKEGRKLFL